ncbi:MAG: 50S ribosomal protein L6, partial [Candidatus Sungbacteria bacterium]|nr:50S ribosomal protein L6 [Candidatus Sungbacteria bacterium]
MSRIGKQPITIPSGVTVSTKDGVVTVAGPKGTLTRTIVSEIGIAVEDGSIVFVPAIETRKTAALWGLMRSLVANMVTGVSAGFEKKLEFEGIGYRAAMEGTTLVMQLGFSHPVRFDPPQGTTVKVERNTITVSGADKETVGLTAATIRN